MNRLFYFKLALNNIKQNLSLYLPFSLVSSFSIGMLYIMGSLFANPSLLLIRKGQTVAAVLFLGLLVLTLFVFIFIFYTYSFIIKRRKREFGLFMILGLEKKHLVAMTFWENGLVFTLITVIGLAFGLLFNKLIFMFLENLIQLESLLTEVVSLSSIAYVLITLSIIFSLLFLNTIKQIYFTKPVELLNSLHQGEQEPKSKWITAILGLICLGSGYTLALVIIDPVDALLYFFLAVILVIVGTYLSFISLSIIMLKLLRQNKRIYYRPASFLNISIMMYRMKQNAVGLANICVLSVMVIVMISSTSALWFGINNSINERYPFEITLRAAQDRTDVINLAEATVNKTFNLTPLNSQKFNYLALVATASTGTVNLETSQSNSSYTVFITAQDYYLMTDHSVELKENEVFMHCQKTVAPTTLKYLDYHFRVIPLDEPFMATVHQNYYSTELNYVVLPPSISLEEFKIKTETQFSMSLSIMYAVNYNLSANYPYNAYVDSMNQFLGQYANIPWIESRTLSTYNQLSINGSFFFIGLFLSIIFIIATAMIMYYKQLSEGVSDQERFKIMQQVGLSDYLIKRTINSQTLTVFFIPLIVAFVHTLFAFPFINLILSAFTIQDPLLLLQTTLMSFIVFGLFYYIVYWLTSRHYYKIVHWNK